MPTVYPEEDVADQEWNEDDIMQMMGETKLDQFKAEEEKHFEPPEEPSDLERFLKDREEDIEYVTYYQDEEPKDMEEEPEEEDEEEEIEEDYGEDEKE